MIQTGKKNFNSDPVTKQSAEESNRIAFKELPFDEISTSENPENDTSNIDNSTSGNSVDASQSGNFNSVNSSSDVVHTDAFIEHVNPLLSKPLGEMSNKVVTDTLTSIHHIMTNDQLMAQFNKAERLELALRQKVLYQTELTFSETNSSISQQSQSVTENITS